MARTGSMEDIQAQEEANMEREVLEGGQAALSAGAKGGKREDWSEKQCSCC